MVNINKISKGFSLLEITIVGIIISILGIIAYPSYIKLKLESNRTEAHAALIAINGAITNYMLLHNKTSITANDLASINLPNSSKTGLYNLSVVIPNTLIADTTANYLYQINAIAKGMQNADLNCTTISIDSNGNFSSKNNNANTSTGCW